MSPMLTSFSPVVDERTAVLVLGTMPGRRSLELGRYYGHDRNQFWPIVHLLFGAKLSASYEPRLEFIRARGIGLWDVLRHCSRDDSSDTSIRDEVPNDLNGLLSDHQSIRAVFFNGLKSERAFGKHVRLDQALAARISFTTLPSTSPANARVSIGAKLEAWRAVKDALDQARTGDGPLMESSR